MTRARTKKRIGYRRWGELVLRDRIITGAPDNIIQKYFMNPDDGVNKPEDYLDEKAYMRTNYLIKIINRYANKDSDILELGSGVGRNLFALEARGYKNLEGVEISKIYLDHMKKTFPNLEAKIYKDSIENWLRINRKQYNIIFSLAVFEHIPKESEWIFTAISSICDVIITIEDERSIGPRHFPRNYGKIFKEYGFKQVFSQLLSARQGLGTSFICRVQKRSRSV